MVGKESVELHPSQSALGEQGSVGFYVGKESLGRSAGKYYGLATERSHLGSSDVESITLTRKPRERDVASLGRKAIAQSGSVNKERETETAANAGDGSQ